MVARLLVLLSSACGLSLPHVRLLPGQSSNPAAWPSYLFVFRGALPDFHHSEVRSAASTLGIDSAKVQFAPASVVDSADSAKDLHDLFQWVAMPSPTDAAAVASRCSTVRFAVDVWACALHPEDVGEPSSDPLEAARAADRRWQQLADAVQADEAGRDAVRAQMLSPLGEASWRVDIFSLGWKKPRSLDGKIELMEKLDALLWGLPGAVELRTPDAIVAMIEDCRTGDGEGNEVAEEGGELGIAGGIAEEASSPEASSADASGVETSSVETSSEDAIYVETSGAVQPLRQADAAPAGRAMPAAAPRALFLGHQLSEGDAAHLATYALSSRSYLGRTTLPPALAILMANAARVVPGTLVLDPFCGTGSTLLSCAARGARTVGIEVDERVLHGGPNGEGVASNFRERGLPPPELLLCSDSARIDEADVLPASSAAHGEAYARFDAIVTDPPYGLMEGLGQYFVPLDERLASLLRLASRRLRVGGRLVFLLPLPAASEAQEVLAPAAAPTARCLSLESVCRQPISMRMHRLMVTMVKVAEPRTPAEGLLLLRTDAEASDGDEAKAAAPWEVWWKRREDAD